MHTDASDKSGFTYDIQYDDRDMEFFVDRRNIRGKELRHAQTQGEYIQWEFKSKSNAEKMIQVPAAQGAPKTVSPVSAAQKGGSKEGGSKEGGSRGSGSKEGGSKLSRMTAQKQEDATKHRRTKKPT